MDQVYGTRPGFFTVGQVSDPIPKQVVTSITFVPLSQEWEHLVWWIGTVAGRVGCGVTTDALSSPVSWIAPPE